MRAFLPAALAWALLGGPASSATFSRSGGEIVIDGLALTLDGKTYRLEDCSNDTFRCFRAADADFAVIVPRKCDFDDVSGWLSEGEQMDITGAEPHRPGGGYIAKGHPHFWFLYHWTDGLDAIFYDPHASGRELAGLDWEKKQAYRYSLVGRQRFLACDR